MLYNTIIDLKFSFPLTVFSIILVQIGELRIINPFDKSMEDLFIEN